MGTRGGKGSWKGSGREKAAQGNSRLGISKGYPCLEFFKEWPRSAPELAGLCTQIRKGFPVFGNQPLELQSQLQGWGSSSPRLRKKAAPAPPEGLQLSRGTCPAPAHFQGCFPRGGKVQRLPQTMGTPPRNSRPQDPSLGIKTWGRLSPGHLMETRPE